MTRGYIETLLELPWNKASEDNKDLANAERILEEGHYGLEKVKERMLEFLAVRNLTSKEKARHLFGGTSGNRQGQALRALWHVRWIRNTCGSASAVCAMRRRSGDTGRLTSEPCRDAL